MSTPSKINSQMKKALGKGSGWHDQGTQKKISPAEGVQWVKGKVVSEETSQRVQIMES